MIPSPAAAGCCFALGPVGLGRNSRSLRGTSNVRPSTTYRRGVSRAAIAANESVATAVGEGGEKVRNVCAVVLAGGVGKRMKADCPKQFLKIMGKTIVERSLRVFLDLEEFSQVVLVVDQAFREQFAVLQRQDKRIVFADPGKERQDSVFNGLQKASPSCDLICIHDAARPLVTAQEVQNVLRDALKHGAAVLGVPCKATVKESGDGEFVLRTIQRTRLWEVQTPQVIRAPLLHEGFSLVRQQKLEVTDDVSIIEQLGKPVKLTLDQVGNKPEESALLLSEAAAVPA